MAEQRYEGTELTLLFDGKRCIHARRCVLGLPSVFQPGVEGDWIVPDAAPADELAALVRTCPSGALRFERKTEGSCEEQTPLKNVVRVLENGPLELRGELRLDGEPEPFRRVLCRCGASSRKPYCDGSHHAAGFTATGEPTTPEELGSVGEGGPLDLRPSKNGPLLVQGPVEVVAGSGRAIRRASKLALCRCGASANKPYCDGSHRRVGFEAEGA